VCGIIGYAGNKEAQGVLLKALRKLEYRGYDSSGIAVRGDTISLYKDTLRVEQLEKSAPNFSGQIGIGHTRWATHGEPSQLNAHPHTDCSGRFAAVHNGVITNYLTLKAELIRDGHFFRSETDTEVIPHLVEKYYQGDLEVAVEAALKRLEGSYAVAVIAQNEKKIVVAKNGSPLVIGLGEGETMIASDVPPLLDITRRVVYLEDGEVAAVSAGEVTFKKDGRPLLKQASLVDWNTEDVQRLNYAHFMLKEIYEQPAVIRNSLSDFERGSAPTVGSDFLGSRAGRGLLILACGTSFHAGLVAKYVIEDLLEIPVRVELASEVNHRERVIPVANAIAISQSGETADVLISMKRLKDAGSSILAITNVKGSSANRLAAKTLFTRAGPELSVAATKTFIAQLIELYKLVLQQPSDNLGLQSSLLAELKTLPDVAQKLLEQDQQIKDCAGFLAQYSNLFYVGRGINYPIALEGALKIKEISYIHAEGYAAGELKHGAFALLQDSTPVVAIVARDFTRDAMITNIKEIKSRKSPVVAIIREDDSEVEALVDQAIKVPATHSLFSPVVNAIAVQLLAYYAAISRDCPVDFPRNLAKSVTVE
jgi:glucosamine--fructose-6-phosphate aminotransferase (isomerizing)